MQPQLQIELITPAQAKRYLARNLRNRPLREKYCDKLAGAIRRGEWQLTGDAIRLDADGNVIDGQHRLTAITRAGTAVQSLVIKGLDPATFAVIDSGIGRTTADVLSIKGEKHSTLLASTTRLLHTYLVTGNPHSNNEHPTRAQQLELLEANPDLYDAVHWTSNSAWARKFIAPGVLSFCYFIFTRKEPAAAHSFFAGLDTGAGLASESPVLLLRNRLAESKSSKEQLHATYRTALIFKAFKLHRDGARIKHLRVRTEGSTPEKDIFVI